MKQRALLIAALALTACGAAATPPDDQVRALRRRLRDQAGFRARRVRVPACAGRPRQAHARATSRPSTRSRSTRSTRGSPPARSPTARTTATSSFPRALRRQNASPRSSAAFRASSSTSRWRSSSSIGKHLWRGKVFYRNERVLRNRIDDTALLKPLIDGDLATIPKITVDGKDQWLMFPARLYCGQSLLDSRRESVIIDYAYTDEIPGYRERPDYPRRAPRLAGARRDPHGAPGLLPGPRLPRQGLPAQLHALEQGRSPSATARRSCRPGSQAKTAGPAPSSGSS